MVKENHDEIQMPEKGIPKIPNKMRVSEMAVVCVRERQSGERQREKTRERNRETKNETGTAVSQHWQQQET